MQSSMKIGEMMYKDMQTNNNTDTSGKPDDGVVDGNFKDLNKYRKTAGEVRCGLSYLVPLGRFFVSRNHVTRGLNYRHRKKYSRMSKWKYGEFSDFLIVAIYDYKKKQDKNQITFCISCTSNTHR